MAELQNKLNSQHWRVSTIKVRALSGKEWDPENWNGDIREGPDEAGDIEPPNSNESSLPVEAASLPNKIPWTECLKYQKLVYSQF